MVGNAQGACTGRGVVWKMEIDGVLRVLRLIYTHALRAERNAGLLSCNEGEGAGTLAVSSESLDVRVWCEGSMCMADCAAGSRESFFHLGSGSLDYGR
jgi:hypothetical protein